MQAIIRIEKRENKNFWTRVVQEAQAILDEWREEHSRYYARQGPSGVGFQEVSWGGQWKTHRPDRPSNVAAIRFVGRDEDAAIEITLEGRRHGLSGGQPGLVARLIGRKARGDFNPDGWIAAGEEAKGPFTCSCVSYETQEQSWHPLETADDHREATAA